MANQGWVPVSWFCVNCGTKVMGFKNKYNKVKAECSKCKIYYVRTYEGRRHKSMKMFYPTEDGISEPIYIQLKRYTGDVDEMKQAT